VGEEEDLDETEEEEIGSEVGDVEEVMDVDADIDEDDSPASHEENKESTSESQQSPSKKSIQGLADTTSFEDALSLTCNIQLRGLQIPTSDMKDFEGLRNKVWEEDKKLKEVKQGFGIGAAKKEFRDADILYETMVLARKLD
jgi:hypothetical protein